MPYLSEFEILSEYIVPPALLPPGATVPFALKGYFVQLSRLAGDGHAGNLVIQLTFFPTAPFPPAANILVDEQSAAGGTNVLALNPQNQVQVAIPPGKTVLVGIQPNFTDSTSTGPLVTPFASRGYVTFEAVAPSPAGFYQLGIAPESRAVFCILQAGTSGPVPDFSAASDIAYPLPTPSSIVVVSH
jgi:hypothetical protein